jgi:transcriptional regulator with XRE-family HTH domain
MRYCGVFKLKLDAVLAIRLTLLMRLRECREQEELSLRALAKKARVHYVSLANIEAGKKDPRLSTLLKLTKALGVSLTELVGEGQERKRGRIYGRKS